MSQIIYGIHPVEEALKSPHIQLEKILIATQKPTPPLQSILHLASQRKIPVTYSQKETLEQIARGRLHQCGVQGIIIPKDRAVGIPPTVIKASAGATAHLPIAKVTNLSRTIEALQKVGIWVYGASGEAKEKIYELDLNMDVAMVIGAEGKGIRPLVKKKCDRLFSIPMKGRLTSFNASVSGGMILYEVMRH